MLSSTLFYNTEHQNNKIITMSFFNKIVHAAKGLVPLKPSALLDMTPAAPIKIASFLKDTADPLQSLNTWHIVTDAAIKGSSRATIKICEEHGIGQFARFEGKLTKRVQANNEPVLSGFAAAQRQLFEPHIELSEYAYVDITMRSDGRPYVLSLRVESMNPRERYQGVLAVDKASTWTTQRLPLANLLLTFNGRQSTSQRAIDGYAKLMSVGIFTADGVDGPFRLDIANITLSAAR
jgi:hypothetical protein